MEFVSVVRSKILVDSHSFDSLSAKEWEGAAIWTVSNGVRLLPSSADLTLDVLSMKR